MVLIYPVKFTFNILMDTYLYVIWYGMLQYVLLVAMDTTARRIVIWIVYMEYVTEDQDNVLWAVKWVGREQHVLQVRTQTVNRIFIKQKKTSYTAFWFQNIVLFFDKHVLVNTSEKGNLQIFICNSCFYLWTLCLSCIRHDTEKFNSPLSIVFIEHSWINRCPISLLRL